MKLSPSQMAQAVTKARGMIKEHSTGFMNFNKMVSDDQISAGLTELLASIADDQTQVKP
jgi:uncharacterized protein YjgD (DUF1641 family)